MKKISEERKVEVIRLRVEERLSLKKISGIMGISKATLSTLLRAYPLTESEVSERCIKAAEVTNTSLHKKYGGMKVAEKRAQDREKSTSKYFKMLKGTLTSNRKGNISEAAVQLRMVLSGLEVYTSTFEGEKLDFVVRNKTGSLIKIQVKTARHDTKYGKISIPVTCSNGRRKYKKIPNKDFDFMVAYDLKTDSAYVLSKREIEKVVRTKTLEKEFLERWDKIVNY